MSLLVARRCTRAAALSMCRRAGAQQQSLQQHAAALSTFTYRAPKTISMQQLSAPVMPAISAASGRRSFWKKAANAADATNTSSPTVPPTPASSESKAERLGFSLPSFSMATGHLTWQRLKTYLVWLSVGGGVLLVFKAGLRMVDFMATISFLDVGEVAFLSGLLSGIGVAACAVLGTRFLRLRPEPIFQHAMRRIANDETVAAYMGRTIKSSDFRAYNFVDGHLIAGPEARAAAKLKGGIYKYYRPKRLQVRPCCCCCNDLVKQMCIDALLSHSFLLSFSALHPQIMFQVVGDNGVTGMATAEVEKNWRGDHVYNLLSVDLVDGRDNSAAERIILEGDPSYRIYKGIVKLR